jgi:hypothetical protein
MENEKNLERMYNLANKVLDVAGEQKQKELDFKNLLILLLVALIFISIVVDRIGYYWADYNVVVQSSSINENRNTNENTND